MLGIKPQNAVNFESLSTTLKAIRKIHGREIHQGLFILKPPTLDEEGC